MMHCSHASFLTLWTGVLDSWVRHEQNVREQEQKRLVDAVMAGVKSKLGDIKMQERLLAQSITDIESKCLICLWQRCVANIPCAFVVLL